MHPSGDGHPPHLRARPARPLIPPPVTKPPVPPLARRLDMAGLASMAVGAAGYGWSWLRMRDLQQGASTVFRQAATEPFAAITQWGRFQTASQVSLGAIGFGLVLAVTGTVVARRLTGGTSPDDRP